MNICIITPRYPFKDDMSFVFVKKLVDEWAKTGHNCTVVTSFSLMAYYKKHLNYRPKYYRDEVAPGVSVDVYNLRTWSFGNLMLRGVSINDWIFSRILNRHMKYLKKRFDIVYNHFFSSSFKSYRYAYGNNIPFFVATGESNIDIHGKPFESFSWDDYRSFTKGIIAVSTKNKQEAAERGLIDMDKCKVFPNGTDLSIFHPLNRVSCRETLGLPKDAFIISCVGYICERKGQDRVLKAVRRLGDRNVKLLFIGREAKTNSVKIEGNEILFKGAVDNVNLPSYLCASDVFCLPTRSEGCCNAVIEALACGLPIISSNLPFNWDVLDETNSILVDPDIIEEISSAICKLRDDKELCKRMSESAIDHAKRLSVSQRASSIMEFITSII